MDPTANLTKIRDLITQIYAAEDNPDPPFDWGEIALELAEHVEALDNWMKSGGFLPTQWRPQR